MQTDLMQVLRRLAKSDDDYSIDAYLIVFEGLDHLQSKKRGKGHVSGKSLAFAIRDVAMNKYGLLARRVLESSGLRTTGDFGNVVFKLVEAGLLGKTEDDSIEDFSGVFDFNTAFDDISRLKKEWTLKD